jgi:predicted O-methyltransferase YrrM
MSLTLSETTSSRQLSHWFRPYRLGQPITLKRLYRSAVRRFLHRTFFFWERLGIHAVPVHFYYPIPDTRTLGEATWSKRFALAGLNWREEEQIGLLKMFAGYRAEYASFPTEKNGDGFFVNNLRFQAVDAEVLYCMIRHFKPRRICEIGSGYSTQLSVIAVAANRAEGAPPCRIEAIEPYPTRDLLELSGVEVRRFAVEEMPLEEFDKLEAGDILFIDSSHVIRTGGDVVHEYLEILPRLKPGVLVHCHDIFLPADYPRRIIMDAGIFWDEQYLFHAFMLFNNAFEILWSSHYMHLAHPEALRETFDSYPKCPTPPASIWIRRRPAANDGRAVSDVAS